MVLADLSFLTGESCAAEEWRWKRREVTCLPRPPWALVGFGVARPCGLHRLYGASSWGLSLSILAIIAYGADQLERCVSRCWLGSCCMGSGCGCRRCRITVVRIRTGTWFGHACAPLRGLPVRSNSGRRSSFRRVCRFAGISRREPSGQRVVQSGSNLAECHGCHLESSWLLREAEAVGQSQSLAAFLAVGTDCLVNYGTVVGVLCSPRDELVPWKACPVCVSDPLPEFALTYASFGLLSLMLAEIYKSVGAWSLLVFVIPVLLSSARRSLGTRDSQLRVGDLRLKRRHFAMWLRQWLRRAPRGAPVIGSGPPRRSAAVRSSRFT